ncbi:uncharacterized protein LOC115628661 [Scaptodrosophila lebanonensis]|uniref:Uncharacterized protein LOC115628661 n=1 Tax=Drosophila lebanonensis TaxID=7225 RepID=A0A6J2TZR1_DROLE|nr:uncharacterized protein LOC115628661 [Scaptodrosophila lebanonensis]
MWSIVRASARKMWAASTLARSFGYAGGVPGNNLPWRKGMDNPMRFTLFYLIIGTVGFGAPWLVVRHQMLRNVVDEPPPPEEEPEPPKDEKKKK